MPSGLIKKGDEFLEIVFVGNSKEYKDIVNLLRKINEVKNVSFFDKFSLAQKHFQDYCVDLVFLDADDDEAGWEIANRKIKGLSESTKVVLMSSSKDSAVKAYEEGIWDYLLKPVKRQQLERIVKKCS